MCYQEEFTLSYFSRNLRFSDSTIPLHFKKMVFKYLGSAFCFLTKYSWPQCCGKGDSLVLFVNRKSSSVGEQPAQGQGPVPALLTRLVDELFIAPCVNRPLKEEGPRRNFCSRDD